MCRRRGGTRNSRVPGRTRNFKVPGGTRISRAHVNTTTCSPRAVIRTCRLHDNLERERASGGHDVVLACFPEPMKIYVWAVVVFMLLAMAGVAGALASHRLHHDCRVRIDTAVDE